jgi:hypothetical protein
MSAIRFGGRPETCQKVGQADDLRDGSKQHKCPDLEKMENDNLKSFFSGFAISTDKRVIAWSSFL